MSFCLIHIDNDCVWAFWNTNCQKIGPKIEVVQIQFWILKNCTRENVSNFCQGHLLVYVTIPKSYSFRTDFTPNSLQPINSSDYVTISKNFQFWAGSILAHKKSWTIKLHKHTDLATVVGLCKFGCLTHFAWQDRCPIT